MLINKRRKAVLWQFVQACTAHNPRNRKCNAKSVSTDCKFTESSKISTMKDLARNRKYSVGAATRPNGLSSDCNHSDDGACDPYFPCRALSAEDEVLPNSCMDERHVGNKRADAS